MFINLETNKVNIFCYVYKSIANNTPKNQTWGTSLKPINVLMAIGATPKNVTLTTTLHKPAGEENPYVRFGYGALTICNYTRGQVSVSMNNDPINMIHTNQKSTKEDSKRTLKEILEAPNINTLLINDQRNKKTLYRFNCSSKS